MRRAVLTCVVLGVAAGARHAFAEAEAASAPASPHRLSAYASGGLQLYLSDARTAGGVGGGLGIRDTLRDRFILQADASYLMFLGNALSVRVAAGVQRRGLWTPAVLLSVSTFWGDHLTFLTPEHPTPIAGPAVALGLSVAPLRFSFEGTQVSLVEVGLSVGAELPGIGIAYQIRALEVGASF